MIWAYFKVFLQIIGFYFNSQPVKTKASTILLTITFALSVSAIAVVARTLIPPNEINKELLVSATSRILILAFLVKAFQLPFPGPLAARINTSKLLPFTIPTLIFLMTISANINKFGAASSDRLILFIIAMLSIGFIEEYIFRGVIFSSLLKQKYSVYQSAVYSSLLFGGVHVVNAILFEYRSWGETLSQMIFAAAVGLFLCGLYYRTKNLWGVIFVHALINISFGTNRLTQSVLHPSTLDVVAKSESSISSLLATLFIYTLIALSGIYMIYQESK